VQFLLATTPEEPHGALLVLGLLSVPLLVLLNGLFVATEFSLVAVRRTRVEELVSQGISGATAVENAVTHLTRSIAATQLGITLASIALGWAGEPALAALLRPLAEALNFGGWKENILHYSAFFLAFLLITFMHVVFGELIPKTLALQKPDRTALWLAPLLGVFTRLTRPLILLMNGTGNLILRWLGSRPAESTLVHSVEELALLVEDTEEAGILEPEQAEVVKNVFRLSEKKVGDCMVPADKMGSLELNTPPEKVLEAVRKSAHTRLPVYDGEPNNIVGIVNTKDLFYLFSVQGVVILQDAMYPALFLRPTEDLGDALNMFRRAHRHMAVVRDEAGKVHGLITLEDILEEIVGELEDEHDRPSPQLKVWRGRLRRPPRRPAVPGPTAASPGPQTPASK
jgi:CBS domain containing-hemolysin-like protein